MSVLTDRGMRLLPLAAALSCASPLQAATIAVNDASTEVIPGKCTLPSALAALNSQTAVDGCVAGDGFIDTIDLSFFTEPTTIKFTDPSGVDGISALAFTKSAALIGPVDDNGKPFVTIARDTAAARQFRVIGTSVDLSVQNVIVSGGYVNAHGAGVYAGGNANIDIKNSIVTGNHTVATKVAGQFGGYYYAGYSGGGVAVMHGNVSISHSTISDNYSPTRGGGIYAAYSGTISLVTSTISGNAAQTGGGAYAFGGSTSITASTVNNNYSYYYYISPPSRPHGSHRQPRGNPRQPRENTPSPVVFGYQAITLTNSTVANNYGIGVGSNNDVGLIFSTISGNVIGVQGTSIALVGSIASGDQKSELYVFYQGSVGDDTTHPSIVNGLGSYGLSFLYCDPKLAPLADNGGPTRTMYPNQGSCAIDAGGSAPDGLSTDQRGLPRPAGVAVDIGAVEAQGIDFVFADGFESSS